MQERNGATHQTIVQPFPSFHSQLWKWSAAMGIYAELIVEYEWNYLAVESSVGVIINRAWK